MKVTIEVDHEFCVLAIAHALNSGITPKNRKGFKLAVIDYLQSYGELCTDDHESEYSEKMEEATAITDKYFRG